MKCFNCDKELEEEQKEEGYDNIYRCSCGAMNMGISDLALD